MHPPLHPPYKVLYIPDTSAVCHVHVTRLPKVYNLSEVAGRVDEIPRHQELRGSEHYRRRRATCTLRPLAPEPLFIRLGLTRALPGYACRRVPGTRILPVITAYFRTHGRRVRPVGTSRTGHFDLGPGD
ncbi:hypothetical protein J6590_011273 [Homalodisca vitripennis]|nr:hypothetical protein J6590_011273 [Homalodisca vitripennis]